MREAGMTDIDHQRAIFLDCLRCSRLSRTSAQRVMWLERADACLARMRRDLQLSDAAAIQMIVFAARSRSSTGGV
jgi:hypothetical protein